MNKLEILQLIARNLYQAHNSITFIDDNVTHLTKPFEAGFNVYLAKWGYSNTEHLELAEKLGIKLLSLDELDIKSKAGEL